ncbi:hypothetical protein [Sporosarcina sp. HYO08]|uniref:hypothetical protein n=1 Tax=Sporosarcina sp. HYO08 TaxID=1759557 RepID=UPI00079A37D6|nr:hypothetical protein [Sporosarcina sp. HYO08]KXH87062.1 hypothetical protein AU377_00330 [Sporosarcina sp. HYO08]
MIIKIAMIGPKDFCERAEQLVSNLTDLALESYIYEKPEEAAGLIRTLKPCDAILFSGSLPYHYAKEALQAISVPIVYLQQDETAIVLTLLRMSAEKKLNMSEISIDIRDQKHLQHIWHDLNEAIALPSVHVLDRHAAVEEVTAFHEEQFTNGQVKMAVTSIHAVYEQLALRNIPTFKMIDPASSILRCIEEAKQKAILHKSKAAQIAVGMVKSKTEEVLPAKFVQQLTVNLQAHTTDNEGVYSLFTTMGNIDASLKDMAFLMLLKEYAGQMKLAFGCGETSIEATENARLALQFDHLDDASGFYVLDSQKKLHGPFPQDPQTIALKVHEPLLVEMAEKTKLSSTNISKLILFNQSRQTKQFTANDLALYLNVTRRTAERMLKKLVAFEYAKIVGEEMAYKQGRPRALYELNFAMYR